MIIRQTIFIFLTVEPALSPAILITLIMREMAQKKEIPIILSSQTSDRTIQSIPSPTLTLTVYKTKPFLLSTLLPNLIPPISILTSTVSSIRFSL